MSCPPSTRVTPVRRSVGLVALTLVACRSTPPPPPEPVPLEAPAEFVVEATPYVGSALAGPAPEGAPLPDPAAPHLVALQALYLRPAPAATFAADTHGLEPLWDAFELALELGNTPGVTATPRLFRGARYATGPRAAELFAELTARPAPEVLALTTVEAVVGPGLAFALEGRTADRVVDPDNFLGEFARRGPIPMGFRASVGASAEGALDWTLALFGPLASDPRALVPPGDERYRPGSVAPTEQLVRPAFDPAPGAPVLVLLPAPFDDEPGRSIAVFVEWLEDGPRAAELLAETRTELAAAAERANTVDVYDPAERTVREAITRLEQVAANAGDLRPVLLFLAAELGSKVASDVLLAARDAELGVLEVHVVTDFKARTKDARWALEAAAWRTLTAAARGDRLQLPKGVSVSNGSAPRLQPIQRTRGESAALEGVLLRHAGEVGRYPRLIENLVAMSVDTEDFRLRLEAENRAFLEDSNPSARVRAFDWLQRRDLAPAGFDPLASAAERRAALEPEPTDG